MIAAMGFPLTAFFLWLGMLLIASIVLGVLTVLVALFYTLLVEIDGDEMRLTYGVGILRKRFDIAALGDARIVRNKWWYGLGMRLTPHGWLYTVSGLDAVEIVRLSGVTFRVGTDEPQALVAAVKAAIQASKSERR